MDLFPLTPFNRRNMEVTGSVERLVLLKLARPEESKVLPQSDSPKPETL